MSALVLPGLDLGPAGRALPDERVRVRQKELGQYFSPEWLAGEMARLAKVDGARVLEPSAGDGALVAACLRAGAAHVLAVELDPAMCVKLVARFFDEVQAGVVEIVCADFLTLPTERFERIHSIVGNPPYDKGMDGDHLARIADVMWEAGVMDATLLLRTVALHSGDRYERAWTRLRVGALYPCVDRIPFIIDGDDSEAGKIDVSVFSITKRWMGGGLCEHLREKGKRT